MRRRRVKRGRIVQTTVYALEDPRNGMIRYVGMTTQPALRKAQHEDPYHEKEHKLTVRWKLELHASGLKPVFTVLAVYNDERTAAKFEKRWAEELKYKGHPILNCPRGYL